MAFDLCQVPVASVPYYIENINTNIWSIEELCYYLYENIYLIDDTICNEVLCDWIRDELGLKRLYRTMYAHLDAQDGIAYFIIPIFREIGYLTGAKLHEYQEKLSRLEIQPGDNRQKLKGDYLVRCGMYADGIREYRQILRRQSPGNLGAAFYAGIWNNLGSAYARNFQFEEAAEAFLKAWQLTHTKETLRKYVSVLPLFLDEEAYQEKLRQIGADPTLIARIQDYNVHVATEAKQEQEERMKTAEDPLEMLRMMEDEYRRSAKCPL